MSDEIKIIDTAGDKPRESTFRMPKLPKWTMAEEIGYKPKTTFWQDFSIADLYGLGAIHDTFRQAFREWQNNVTYVAELALVLNHKGCFYYAAAERYGNDERLDAIAQVYFVMYHAVNGYAKKHFKDDDAEYYFRVTD